MIARIDQDDTLPLDQVVHGECLSVMRSFPDNSVDSIITDPPAGIFFMNKNFDSNRGGRDKWILWLSTIMKEALRVLRPGGHCLVWSLPRTSHWTGLALERAGFEMRDCLYHTQAQDSAMAAFEASLSETQRDALARLIDSQETYPSVLALFGSGFPKSTAIDKAIDKHYGKEREVIGLSPIHSRGKNTAFPKRPGEKSVEESHRITHQDIPMITAPSTDDAKKWVGWGNNLKPACENWWLCRKPLSEKTLAANVLRWNCGGLNIDKSRVGVAENEPNKRRATGEQGGSSSMFGVGNHTRPATLAGKRFPSNVLFSHSLFCTDDVCDEGCPVRALEQQSGVRKSGARTVPRIHTSDTGYGSIQLGGTCEASTGTASRFFHCFTPDVPFLYCAKSSRSERNLGCEGLEPAQTFDKNTSKRIAHINHETGNTTYNDYIPSSNQNTHPTVKSLSLMKYLCTLICPPDGIVLDPFFGSGSTGVAALQSGLHFVGIEQELEYVAIARARIAHAMRGE